MTERFCRRNLNPAQHRIKLTEVLGTQNEVAYFSRYTDESVTMPEQPLSQAILFSAFLVNRESFIATHEY
jgi:hypothetical protein